MMRMLRLLPFSNENMTLITSTLVPLSLIFFMVSREEKDLFFSLCPIVYNIFHMNKDKIKRQNMEAPLAAAIILYSQPFENFLVVK